MKTYTQTLLLIFGLLSTSLLMADDTEINLQVVDQHIVPSYEAFLHSTQGLDTKAQAFCKNPSAETRVELQASFHDGMDTWQSIQHIRFGPIEFLLRSHRIQMWPDKRSSVSKHMRKLLAANDIAVLEANRFTSASVALQGFSALERLLFNPKLSLESFTKGEEGQYRCTYMQAITNNLHKMSLGLMHDWLEDKEAHRAYIATAVKGNEFYESDKEVSAKLLNNLHTQLQLIIDQKLSNPMGKNDQSARGKRAESWRSDRSSRNIAKNLSALEALYIIGFEPRLTDKALGEKIHTAFSQTQENLAKITLPLHLAVADTTDRKNVDALLAEAQNLTKLFGSDLPKALDLPLGFNSLDGD